MPEVNMDKAERIAFRSTQGTGAFAKSEWNDFAVYFFAEPIEGGYQWMAERWHRSTQREDRRHSLLTTSLSSALAWFDVSRPADFVRRQARDWFTAHGDSLKLLPPVHHEEAGKIEVYDQRPAATDQAALEQLFGGNVNVLEASRLLGVNESTLRLALKTGTGVRIGLRAILPFVDINAFRKHALEARNG